MDVTGDLAGAPPDTLTIVAGVDQLAGVQPFVRERVAGAGGDEDMTSDFVQAVDELGGTLLSRPSTAG